jgi:hypothetical protein
VIIVIEPDLARNAPINTLRIGTLAELCATVPPNTARRDQQQCRAESHAETEPQAVFDATRKRFAN